MWQVAPFRHMRVPGIIFATEELVKEMDEKVLEQLANVASLPGIVKAAFAMPDAHWGYGFPIGCAAAFDADAGGIVSAGGVGFDISCGVRCILTDLAYEDIKPYQDALADALFHDIPSGMGRHGRLRLNEKEMNDMLKGGAAWAINEGYGEKTDLQFIEEHGCMQGAIPENVSQQAKHRQYAEMGTLGSGNHYLEVQEVKTIFDDEAAQAYGIHKGQIVVSVHCGSRGLGHQIGTEYLREMVINSSKYGLILPDRELACAPLKSELGQRYLGVMRAGINCALANRQIIDYFIREAFSKIFPQARLKLLYDVSHNTCKEEKHLIDGKEQILYVHRKGATRAFGPGHDDLPKPYKHIGQPVLIGGTMGTSSYILSGNKSSEDLSFSSACHGAGRSMSRNQARKKWQGQTLMNELSERGILIRSDSYRGVAEEAPDAYKDVDTVVQATQEAGLARPVAKLKPLICVKG
jgi:tRNA-splicing ligase RtcB